MSTFPATNSNEAVELIIDGGNQLHQIINEDATTEIQTESGPIPSVRKALADSLLFLDPVPWQQGSDEISFNQLRTFNGNIYWAPTATLSNPVPMGATPIGDSNWNIAPVSLNEQDFKDYVDEEIAKNKTLAFPYLLDNTGNVPFDGDERLVVDTLISVEDYAEDHNSGRLYFKVVPLGTGSADNGKYIDLPLSGLQLQQNLPSPLNVLCFGAKGDGVKNDRPSIQAAIDYIQSTGKRRVLYSPANRRYSLQSALPVANYPTYKSCLTITDLSKVRIDFNGSIIVDDVEEPKDCVIALAPTTSNESAFANITGFWVEGNQTVRPTNVLKANFGSDQLRYCTFSDMRLRFANEDILLMDGFVIEMTNIRCSFAGVNGSNFHLSNTTSAANTGYDMNTCVADFGGLYGYRFSGSNGHTYCSLKSCYADFIGRDDSNTTIDANKDIAAGYRLENVRVVNLTACGTEFCSRSISTLNPRAMTIDGLYNLGLGHSDGTTTVKNRMEFEGFFETVTISGVQFNNASSPASNIVDVTSPNQLNQNRISVLDGSLLSSYFNYTGGDENSSNLPLINTPEDQYVGYVRKGAGDALVTGSKLIGSTSSSWFTQSTHSAEQTFNFSTDVSGDTFKLLTLTNPNVQGLVGFIVDVNYFSLDGGDARLASSYKGGATSGQNNNTVSPLDLQTPSGFVYGTPPSIAWNGNDLELTVPTPFAAAHVKVTATGRPSVGTQTFEWL